VAACDGLGTCSYGILTPQSYTPPFPPAWYLTWFGPCGCNGPTFISTTSDHPLYAFYQPTSGLDDQDACGNYYYNSFGALDATGPFDCTSGGRFVLLNHIAPAYLGGGCTSTSPCNGATNVFMGLDNACADECDGFNFTFCHPGCMTTGNYATIEPIPTERVLPHTNWTPPDQTGNMLCCPSSGSSAFVPDIETIFAMTLAQGNVLHFHYGVFGGLFVQVAENVWRMNYPPLSFELVKSGTTYSVNGIEATLLLDDPLMIEIKIGDEVLEIHGD
jgi:hypothetical protein